jgi:hypothetical protein
MDPNSGNASLFQRIAMRDNCRRTGASVAYPQDSCISLLLDFSPQPGVILGIRSVFLLKYESSLRKAGFQGFLQFFVKLVSVRPGQADYIDRFPLQSVQPWSHGGLHQRRQLACRINDCKFIFIIY